MANFIMHEGVEGMKWGVRNGPPYPLSRQAKTNLGMSFKRKDKALAVLNNADEFTNDELRKYIERIKLEEELRSMTEDARKKGDGYVKKILLKVGDKVLSDVVPAATAVAVKALLAKTESEFADDMIKEMDKKSKK